LPTTSGGITCTQETTPHVPSISADIKTFTTTPLLGRVFSILTNKKPAEANLLAGFRAALYLMPRLIHSKTERGERLAGLIPPAAAFSFAPLGAVFLLDADEAQAAAMLTDDAGALDALCEPAQ
jgi:hypothetical protein